MINGRKRHRSPSTSSDELDPYHRSRPQGGQPFTREQTLSPTRAGSTTDLETSDGEYFAGGDGYEAVGAPARKRRRGVLRNKLEKMGLVNEEPTVIPDQSLSSGNATGWNLPTHNVGTWMENSAATLPDDSGLDLRETSARERIPFEDLGRVAYPTTIESPLEESGAQDESSGSWFSSAAGFPDLGDPTGGSKDNEDDDSMMMDQNGQYGQVDETNKPGHANERKSKKTWYEPEKDRIVVTSLSDSEDDERDPSSSHPLRSSCLRDHRTDGLIDLDDEADVIDITHQRPDNFDMNGDEPLFDPNSIAAAGRYTQPGVKGFTISPSLLSRLNQLSERQRAELSLGLGLGRGGWDDRLRPSGAGDGVDGKLILYKALPGLRRDGALGAGYSVNPEREEEGDDAMGSRFEVIQDDEVGTDGGMEVDDAASGRIDVGQGMDMDDMEMG